jgi:voltage-gated potassium channel
MSLELSNVLRRLRIAGGLFILVMLMGTTGYKLIGGPDTALVDAVYMTGITISTLGYHEVIPLEGHPYGRLFTLFMVFSGFAVITYFFSNIVALFIEGDIRKTFTKRRMQKKIEKMQDHFIICGTGRVGRNIAYELHHTEHDFVVADIIEEPIEVLQQEFHDIAFLVGDCTDDTFLQSLGVEKARGIFVVGGDDNTNLVICLTARQLNPEIKIVSRTKDVLHVNKMKSAGADRVVSPNYIGGIRMAAEMLRPAAVSFMDELLRTEFDLNLEECIIPEYLDGQPISNYPIQDLEQTMILALRSEKGWRYNPSKSHVMKQGEHIVLITNPVERKILESRMN